MGGGQLRTRIGVGLFVAALVVLILWPSVTVSIHSGQVGVLYSRLFGGTVRTRIYEEGIHFIFPWDIMYVYDARAREYHTDLSMLTKDGLAIEVAASIRYRIVRSEVTDLHVEYGPNYEAVVIAPIFLSSIREAIGQYRPDELYSTAPQEIQERAMVEAVRELSQLPLRVETIMVKWIKLPPAIAAAIETKLTAEQELLRYQFVLQKTYKEALRQVIEAEGTRLYQEGVNPGLTDNFLRFRGIEATAALAASTNSKIVVVGGKDGLPLILNPDNLAPPSPQGQAAPSAAAPEVQGSAPPPGQGPAAPPLPYGARTAGALEAANERLQTVTERLNTLWQTISSAKLPAKTLDLPLTPGPVPTQGPPPTRAAP